jgi:hypothetical protein
VPNLRSFYDFANIFLFNNDKKAFSEKKLSFFDKKVAKKFGG